MKSDVVIKVILFSSIFINIIAAGFLGYKYYLRVTYSSIDQTTINSSYWQDKVAFFEILNRLQKGGTYLVGDSMFDRLNIEEILFNIGIYNRGIGFDNTRSLSLRLDRSVLSGAPEKILLFIGGNDLTNRDEVEGVIADTEKIIETIIANGIKLCFVSLLPKGEKYSFSRRSVVDINKDTLYFNKRIKKKCDEEEIVFLDITQDFVTDNFFLDSRFTSDEIHLNAQGVVLLAKLLEPYVY